MHPLEAPVQEEARTTVEELGAELQALREATADEFAEASAALSETLAQLRGELRRMELSLGV